MSSPSGTTNYAYNSLNQLVGVTTPTDTWTYQYDALGNVIATTHNGQLTQNLVDPTGSGGLVAQFDGSGTLLERLHLRPGPGQPDHADGDELLRVRRAGIDGRPDDRRVVAGHEQLDRRL